MLEHTRGQSHARIFFHYQVLIQKTQSAQDVREQLLITFCCGINILSMTESAPPSTENTLKLRM